MIRQLEMSSLRALEREAILAAQGSCYVTLARWISAPVTFINCATSLGVSAVKFASIFRRASGRLGPCKAEGMKTSCFVSSRPSSEPVYLRCAPVRLTDQRSAAPTRAGESSALASCALGPIPVCYP